MICKQSESGMEWADIRKIFFFGQLWVLEVEFARRGIACEDTCNEIQSPGFVFLHENEQNKIRATAVEWKCLMYVVFTGRKNVEESWVLHLLYLYPCKYVSLHSPHRNAAFPECRGFPKPALCYSPLYEKLLLHYISRPVLKVASMFFKVYFVIRIFTTEVTVLFVWPNMQYNFWIKVCIYKGSVFIFWMPYFSMQLLLNCCCPRKKKKKKKDVFDKFPKDFKDSFKHFRNMFLNISIWLFPLHFFPNCYLIGNNDLPDGTQENDCLNLKF